MKTDLKRIRYTAFVATALAGGAAVVALTAQSAPPTRFSEADIYVELNHTDGDLGLHASIDGGPWTRLEVEGPGERTLLDIFSRGALRRQGMTQLFFESAEPSFDELAPAAFFRRFPEGRYEIEGTAHDGTEIESTTYLSHVLAAPPDNVLVSGVPAAESCDAGPLPSVAPPVVIDWDPVTASHPDIGRSGSVRIAMYQLFVEREGVKLSLDLPPSITEFEVPTAITALGTEFKFEIIARTTRGNNTAIESCFEVQ
jgi:hypothetical protein